MKGVPSYASHSPAIWSSTWSRPGTTIFKEKTSKCFIWSRVSPAPCDASQPGNQVLSLQSSSSAVYGNGHIYATLRQTFDLTVSIGQTFTVYGKRYLGNYPCRQSVQEQVSGLWSSKSSSLTRNALSQRSGCFGVQPMTRSEGQADQLEWSRIRLTSRLRMSSKCTLRKIWVRNCSLILIRRV